jgi:quinol monooxygenase YgiN
MAFVVAATYRCKEGEEEKIRETLETMAPLSRGEPGCLFYQAHRSGEDPRVFFLYEQYVDEAGYEAHMATEHFVRHIKGEAIPRLESRERAFYETIDA